MSILFALLLVITLLVGWFLTLLGLPGNWLMVVATAIYAYPIPVQSPAALGWRTVVAILVLATLGEIVELQRRLNDRIQVDSSRRADQSRESAMTSKRLSCETRNGTGVVADHSAKAFPFYPLRT